jgi:glycosyltransferase involved in cell wall biosynthesis
VRLCLVSQEYPPETAHGGIATQTHAKAHGLARRGHDVTVLSHAVDGARHEAADGPVRVVRIPSDAAVQSEAERWIARAREVAAELRVLQSAAGPFDAIDFPDYGAEGFAHLAGREGERGPACVLHLHGGVAMLAAGLGWPERGSPLHVAGGAMEGACLALADAVFASSAYTARAAGLDPARVPVLHAGVDTRAFHPAPTRPPGPPTVVFVGRVARSKGADVLLSAAALARREVPDLRLLLVGRVDDALPNEVLRAAGAEALGHVPRERLPEVLRGADLHAAPSPWEAGPGLVHLEAMASGLPSIGCSGSGVEETIRDGETGFLVPPGDADTLAAALRTLLLDAPRRRRMGEAARAGALGLDTEGCVARIEDLYWRAARR